MSTVDISPLKLARINKGLDVSDVAKHLGVHKKTIWVWERGEALPKPVSTRALADLLEVDAGELYTDMHVWRESK